MKLRGTFYHCEFDEENSKLYLYLKAKDKTIIGKLDFSPYFFVIPKNLEVAKEELKKFRAREKGREIRVTKIEEVSGIVDGVERKLLKVFVPHVDDGKVIEKKLGSKFEFREVRIEPWQRFILDKKIEPFSILELEGKIVEEKESIVKVECKDVRSVGRGSIEDLKFLYLDCVVYSEDGFPKVEKDPILLIGCLTNEGKMKIFKASGKNDKKMLADFIKFFKEYDPDLLVGYGQDTEDFPYLIGRARVHKLKLDLGKEGEIVEETGKYFRGMIIKETKIRGRINIDLLPVIYRDFPQLPTKRLNEVYEELELGEFEEIPAYEVKKLTMRKIEEYAREKLKAIKKVSDKLLGFQFELSKLCYVIPNKVTRLTIGELVDSLILKEGKFRNWIFRDRGTSAEGGYYMGGEVWLKAPGIYENIIYYDIRSMYPSIIKLYGLSPEVLDCSCCKGKKLIEVEEKGKKIKHWICQKREGLLAEIVSNLIEKRMKIKEQMKKAKGSDYEVLYTQQYALRIISNAVYGYTGWTTSRLYRRELAETITALGRNFIRRIKEFCERNGLEPIYLDTDGIQVLGKKSIDPMKFLEKLNKELPLNVELRYVAKRGIFFAKKKYCHLVDGRIEAKGVEFIRRDYPKFIKEVQKGIIEILLKEKDVRKARKFMEGMREKLIKRRLRKEDLVLVEQLAKKIEMYERTSKIKSCAEWLLKERKVELHRGMNLEIIIIKGPGPINYRARPVQFFSEEDLDWDYYLRLFDQVMERTLNVVKVKDLSSFLT